MPALSEAIDVSDDIVAAESDIVVDSVEVVPSSVFFDWQAAARETIVITNKADFRMRFMSVRTFKC